MGRLQEVHCILGDVVLIRYGAFWEMEFPNVLHWLRINSGGSEGVGVEFKILSLADKIYLFMKMRKKKHTNRRLTKKYCRIRGKITLKSQRNRKYYLFQVKTIFF